MEIIQLGTASIWPAEFSSSFLIDGHILVDCPNGLIKQMKRLDLDILKIDTVLITHFHADHYFDLPLLYLELAFDAVERGAQSCPLTLAGPSGIRAQTETLYRLAYADTAQAVYETIPFRYIDLAEDGRQHRLRYPEHGGGPAGAGDPAEGLAAGDGQIYDLRAYPVIHGVTEAWGYTVTCREKTAGFTGDTSFCPGMEEIVRASDLAFVEASYPVHQSVHMGIDKILELQKKYPEKRIIPTHMGREARRAYEEAGGRAPADGTVWRL